MNRLFFIFASLLLTACSTTYTRAEIDHFKSRDAGTVSLAALPRFADCVMDGFQTAHPFSNMNVRQQRRSDGIRVETFAGSGSGMIMISVDVRDSGHVELWESDAALLINTRTEREMFAACLKQASS